MKQQVIQLADDREPADVGPGSIPDEIRNDPISLTECAIENAKERMTRDGISTHGLRVSTSGGGCSGLRYELDFAAAPHNGDTILELDGLKVFVDGESVAHLCGMTIDYTEALNGGGFKFVNPNATRTCGCGESFAT